MAATEPRLAGWVETRYAKRRGQYQSRLRYRPSAGTPPVTVEEVWHDSPAGRTDNKRLEYAAKEGRRLLGDAQLDLTQRLRLRTAPAFQRGALTTLGYFWDEEWEKRALRKRPANTRANYHYSFKNWVRPYLGGISLDELAKRGTEIGRQWITALQEDNAGVATIEYAISVAKSVLGDAIEWEWVAAADNPMRFVRAPEREFKEEVEFALEIEHVCLTAWMTPTLGDVLWAELIGTEALRQQEIVLFRLSDLFHEDGSPLSRMKVTKAVSGKGRHRHTKGLKGGSGRRSPELFPEIAKLARLYVETEHPTPDDLSARLFPANSWDGIRDIDNWRDDVWEPALRRAGIEQDGRYGHITPHRFRGAAASSYGYARWSEAELLTHVGHKHFTTSLQWYIRAYENPVTDLQGMHPNKQIERARRVTLDRLRAHLQSVASPAYAILEEKAKEALVAACDELAHATADGEVPPGLRTTANRARIWEAQVRHDRELERSRRMVGYLEQLID